MDDMNVIPDEDFDRLWDEAVAEAAVKSIKQLRSHSRSKGQRYAPSSKQLSNRRETVAVVHQRVEKSSGNLLTRRRASESIKNELTRRPRSESNSHELTRQPRSESNEHGLIRRRSSESVRNELTRRRSSESNGHDLIRRRSSESNGHHDLIRRRSSETNSQELAHRSSSESSGQSRRRSSESSSGHELPHRRSTISKVPSLPRLAELTKDTMYGREDLSASSYSSGLNTASSNKYAMDDCSSVSSLASGFSGFESVSIQHEQPQRSLASETRRKQLGETRSKSRSPTRDAKKQKSTEGGQKEVVNYILEAYSSEQQQLLFEIPTIFEVKGHKENRNQSTGLVLTFGRENDTGTVVVKGISPTSLFANTRLKSGHEILMINSHRVKSPQQAAKIMKSLSGDVTIYVSEGTRAPGMKYIRVKAGSKKMMNGHNGHIDRSLHSAAKDVTLVTRNDRLVRVSHVDPDGAFSKNLSAGDVVITVNGTLVQNDEEAMKLLLDTTNHGIVCMLVYSMANLCKGLIDQLLPGWKRWWVSEAEVTVSRDNVSFSIVWRDDWVCDCNHSDEEAVYNSDIQPAIGKINVATSFVINSIIDASEVQRKQIALDADCNTCTATTDPTTEESTDNESDKAGHEPEESRQVTDPSIEEGSDNGDVSGESGHAPTETLQESSKSKRPPMHKRNSLYLELNGDDESSVEDC
eukprot:scaffold7770_cov121-Skeletonema_marinoi.AAC.5